MIDSTRRMLVPVLALGALLALSTTAVLGGQDNVALDKTADNGGALVEIGGDLTYTLTAQVTQTPVTDAFEIWDTSLDPGQYIVDNATWSVTGTVTPGATTRGDCAFAAGSETDPDVECPLPPEALPLPVGAVVTVTIEGHVNDDPAEACPPDGVGGTDTNMTNRGEAGWTDADGAFTVIDPPADQSAINIGINCAAATPRPDTTINSGPSGTVNSTSATFTFTATNGATSFECMLDSGAWAACTSPKTYTGLSNGTHTFQVRGINATGADETPASRTWTVSTGGTPPPPPPGDDHPFTDIDGNQFENDIIWLYNAGITGGCTTDRFCPSSNVLRDQMASFLDRALDLPATTVDFFDDDDGNIHEGAINRLAAAGITGGCDVRQYCPKSNVLRDQMASFLVRAFNLPLTATDYFGDDEGNLHENQINALANSGITGGCGPGRYCPTNPVTRGQMAAFLHRALD